MKCNNFKHERHQTVPYFQGELLQKKSQIVRQIESGYIFPQIATIWAKVSLTCGEQGMLIHRLCNFNVEDGSNAVQRLICNICKRPGATRTPK